MAKKVNTKSRPRYGEGRVALMRAAISVVAEKGIAGLTYRELARAAGMTHGAVLHHFESITDLLAASIDYCTDQLLQTRLGNQPLENFLQPVSDAMQDSLELQRFEVAVAIEAQRLPILMPVIERMYDAFREYTLQCLHAAGIEGDEGMAELLMGITEGVVYKRVVFGQDAASKTKLQVDAMRRLLQVYLSNMEKSK